MVSKWELMTIRIELTWPDNGPKTVGKAGRSGQADISSGNIDEKEPEKLP